MRRRKPVGHRARRLFSLVDLPSMAAITIEMILDVAGSGRTSAGTMPWGRWRNLHLRISTYRAISEARERTASTASEAVCFTLEA
jgi:hypothetical protein